MKRSLIAIWILLALAVTVVIRKNFDKYPEAPPWVLMLPNRSLIAVWAEQLPPGKGKWPGNYLLSAASSDGGKNWSQPLVVHSDRTDGEHSFGSLAPQDDRHAAIVWLDSRDYQSKHTYRLMSAVISSSGSVSGENTVDDDRCTCCPTALINAPQGLIAAYRNHTSKEIRDGRDVLGSMSVMESIANLDIDLPWVIPVKATKGLTVIEFYAAIRHVEGIHRCGEAFAEVFAQRDIERRVPR
jgi:hypothetical protein